jgi:uncharacterized membrane protein YphA (DoxX/SURF4 family)
MLSAANDMQKRLALAALVVGCVFVMVGAIVFLSATCEFINSIGENIINSETIPHIFGMGMSLLFIFTGIFCLYASKKLKEYPY